MSLSSKYAPQTLNGHIAGHVKVVATLQWMMKSPDFGPEYILLEGATGMGKTSIANCVVNDLGCSQLDVERIGGGDCTVDRMRELEHTLSYCSHGVSGWRACIIDEAHHIQPRALSILLTLIETMPKKRVVIFTTIASLTAETFGTDCKAFLGRCKRFRLDFTKEDKRLVSDYVRAIAVNENLDGRPQSEYDALCEDKEYNVRDILGAIQMGEMLP